MTLLPDETIKLVLLETIWWELLYEIIPKPGVNLIMVLVNNECQTLSSHLVISL